MVWSVLPARSYRKVSKLPSGCSYAVARTEPHFIGQDAVDTIVEERNHPIEALDLVLSHRPPFDICDGHWHVSPVFRPPWRGSSTYTTGIP